MKDAPAISTECIAGYKRLLSSLHINLKCIECVTELSVGDKKAEVCLIL
jgi:hypothetical protein